MPATATTVTAMPVSLCARPSWLPAAMCKPSHVDGYIRVFARCVVLVAMALAFVAFGVGATPAAPPPNACQGQWTVPSPLQFQQGFKYYITFYLKQRGTTISGKAGYQIGSKVTVGNVGG